MCALKSSSGTHMITVSSIIRKVSVRGNFLFYSLGKIVLFVLEAFAALPLESENVGAVNEVSVYISSNCGANFDCVLLYLIFEI